MRDYFERRRRLRQLQEEAIAQRRLPPGQALTVKWPTLHAGPVPRVDLAAWRFRIFGLVEEPVELDWRQFSSLPRVTTVSDIHCVTRWTKLDNTWEGVRATDVLRLAAVKPEAQFVMVHAPGYSANLPLEALLSEDALFALKHDGEELERVHGGPVRLVVPQRYFWKSVKWVDGLELMAEDRPGYWEQRGYHNEGDPWAEERFGPW
jgi:DMSO/TMAO reductase YedYZ molybdopterin-dependent catalytic subunit